MPIVAPYAGAWIETVNQTNNIFAVKVAPYAGAWIETYYPLVGFPMFFGRPLCGGVD